MRTICRFVVSPRADGWMDQADNRTLQYLNNKAGYVSGIAKVINWAVAEERYTKGLEAGSLKL